MSSYEATKQQSQLLRHRMRNGTGANRLLSAEDAPTHYLDSLQRFKKDFASYDKQQRQADRVKRQIELQKKRLQQLERQNRRWEEVQSYQNKLKEREDFSAYSQWMGAKRTANTSSLAYNPISLSYDLNPQGQRLKRLDQQSQIRRFVRVRNMQDRGNSKYNPINGQYRKGIQEVVPQQLTDRFSNKLYEHYDGLRLKPLSSQPNRYREHYSKY